MTVTHRYELRVVAEFAAAHVLRGYPGACDRVHGHNFKVEAEVVAHALDSVGMGVDFHELERLLHGALAPLDHRMLNELPAFADQNPTAENIAAQVFDRLDAALRDRPDGQHARLVAITVRENDRFSVRYVVPTHGAPATVPRAAPDAEAPQAPQAPQVSHAPHASQVPQGSGRGQAGGGPVDA